MTYRQKLEALESELSGRFTELTQTRHLIFICQEEDENQSALEENELYEMRNDITGNVFDVYVISVNEGIIKVVETDGETFHEIKLGDFSSTLDRINIIEAIEATQFSSLTRCNNCDLKLLDENPKEDAPEYAVLYGEEQEMVFIQDGEDSHWVCPNCKTDEYLTDNPL